VVLFAILHGISFASIMSLVGEHSAKMRIEKMHGHTSDRMSEVRRKLRFERISPAARPLSSVVTLLFPTRPPEDGAIRIPLHAKDTASPEDKHAAAEACADKLIERIDYAPHEDAGGVIRGWRAGMTQQRRER
jgi:hypothetical protein